MGFLFSSHTIIEFRASKTKGHKNIIKRVWFIQTTSVSDVVHNINHC
jgi:hypothetical protein